MAETSTIEWTDATLNVVTGCTKVSPGCANCYIERTPPFRKSGDRFTYRDDGGHPAVSTEVILHPDRLGWPLKWKTPRRIFTCSLGDLFHEAVPDEFIIKTLEVMRVTPRHTYQVLTKRPERMRAVLTAYYEAWHPRLPVLPNVWPGTSVENQTWADRRIPPLLETPAAVRFLSVEPLLGPVDLSPSLVCRRCSGMGGYQMFDRPEPGFGRVCGACHGSGHLIGWIIAGGESGPGARPMAPDWPRSLRDQCTEAGVPFFMKQMGERWAKENGGPRHGGEIELWPNDLQIRQFPEVIT